MLISATGLSFCTMQTVHAQSQQVSISNAQAKLGENVKLTVEIAGNPGITSVDFSVVYDNSQIELIDKINGNLLGGTMNSQTISKVPYYCGWINSLQKNNCTDDGILMTLIFKVKDSAANGKKSVSFTEDKVTAYDADIKKVLFDAKNGYIEVNDGTEPAEADDGNITVNPSEPETPGDKDNTGAENINNPEQKDDAESQLTAQQKKIADSVKAMKVKCLSAKYSKKAKTVKLKYKKLNKSYKLDGYQIYKSKKKNSAFKKVGVTAKQTWKCRLTGKKGDVYYYKTRGFRNIGDTVYYTKWSNVKSVTIR